MEIKLTNGDINALNDSLMTLSNEVFDYDTSYWLFKLAKQLEEPIMFWDKYKNTINDKYVIQDGENLIVPKEKYEDYKKEIETYLLKEVTIIIPNKISANNFKDKKVLFQFLIVCKEFMLFDNIKKNEDVIVIENKDIFNIINIIKKINKPLSFDLAFKISNITNQIDFYIKDMGLAELNVSVYIDDLLTKADLQELELPLASFYLIEPLIKKDE